MILISTTCDIQAHDLFNLLTNNMFMICDDLIEHNCADLKPPVTFRRNSEHDGSFIDNFRVTSDLQSLVSKSYIIDSGDNLSDHLPICIELTLTVNKPIFNSSVMNGQPHLRWDKGDIISYYNYTYNLLSCIPVSGELWNCLKYEGKGGCMNVAQWCVNNVYNSIVNGLSLSAEAYVPCTKPGFYKLWWNEALSEMKEASIAAYKMWIACNRPRQLGIFLKMKSAKIAVKRAIKIGKDGEDFHFSDELNDLLLSKDITGFWHSWNAKMGASRGTPVIDGITDNQLIAQNFADIFKNNCNTSQHNKDDMHSFVSSLCDIANILTIYIYVYNVAGCY
jgi:hypothetical protein